MEKLKKLTREGDIDAAKELGRAFVREGVNLSTVTCLFQLPSFVLIQDWERELIKINVPPTPLPGYAERLAQAFMVAGHVIRSMRQNKE